MSRERSDNDVHVRPERKARSASWSAVASAALQMRAVCEPSGHAPDRTQDPRLCQRPSPLELGLLQRGRVLRVELDGESNLYLDQELHRRVPQEIGG